MQLIAYLNFDGNCREAFDFYAQVLGGTVRRFSYGDSPMAADMPKETHERTMHAQLEAHGAVLQGADGPPGSSTAAGCVNIQVDDVAEAERIFAAISAGGSVQMPIDETFWAHRFGMCVDKFGKGWMVNCLKPMQ